MTNKILVALGAFVLTALFILWEYFNGGVITHHLLAREDLPGISNWWGLLTVPLLSWISVSLIQRRKNKKTMQEPAGLENFDNNVLKGFVTGLLFGISVSLFWAFNMADMLQYFILLPALIAFFKPVHLPEHLWGFVIGMSFTFGGILPIMIGTVLLVLCFLVHTLMGIIKKLFLSKAN